MHGLRRRGCIACVAIVLVLLVSPGMAAAQTPPSHTQANPPSSGGFQFPDQLALFEELALHSSGIIANVSRSNFTNADAHFAAYSAVVDKVNASVNDEQQQATVDAMKASRDDFSSFIAAAKRFDELYALELGVAKVNPRSNVSIANAIEMKALSARIKELQNSILGRNSEVYGSAIDNGLDPSKYGNTTTALMTYSRKIDSRLTSVTAQVFRDAALTLTPSGAAARYGDELQFTGRLSDGQAGIANAAVDLYVDNSTATTVRTNAKGSFEYRLTVRDMGRGNHAVFAKYAPTDAPYNPAQSDVRTLAIDESPVNNAISALSSSVALGSNLAAQGRLMTAEGPVANGTVLLYLGDHNVARTQTDQNGSYAFSASTSPYYFPAVLNGATVYTIFEPHGEPLTSATSAVTHVPVDMVGAYAGVAAVIGAALLGVTVVKRGRARVPPVLPQKAPTQGEALPTMRDMPPALPAAPPASAPASLRRADVRARIADARAAFKNGDDQGAMDVLHTTALTLVTTRSAVKLSPSMTHWEKYAVLRAAVPELAPALRELTAAYQSAHYSSRALTGQERSDMVNALVTICSRALPEEEE
ncbi:MAG: DUF4129 domain-containing protein [Halobacteriota archaeon]